MAALGDEKELAVGAYIFSGSWATQRRMHSSRCSRSRRTRGETGPVSWRGAIQALGSIGPSATPVVARLKAIAARDPEGFEESVTRAMVHIWGAAAIEGRQAEARAQERCRTKGTSGSDAVERCARSS